MYYKCKKNLNHVGSYIDSRNWIKIKKVAIDHVNKRNNKCFQYAITKSLSRSKSRTT